MTGVLVAALVLLVALVIALVVGRVDGGLVGTMPEPTRGMRHEPLPERRLTSGDVERVRFDLVLRGYRMDEVDAVLARLTAEIEQLERENLELRFPDPQAPAVTAD